MNKLRSLWPPVFALAVVGIAGWTLYKLAQAVWLELVGVNPQLAVAVVAAGTTLIASTATVMLGRYYERRKEIEAHFRAEKIKIYDEFLAQLFKLFESEGDSPADMVKFLREWQRKLILWGGSNVLGAYFKWMSRLKQGNPDAETVFLMDEFFRALRADIGQSSSGLPKGTFAHLILRHGDFFLEQAARNPRLTLEELGQLEKAAFVENKG
ncbi:hypothetical protein SBP18_02270 [Rhodoferax ferrireducens]|uniref:hypothetical protein n=1 Tax=Rhodoferax ferrireducens TaxID=192843 RepID=UPI00298E19AE|nr:hypothetical protein [Rhodoferax ferrireducens]WPC67347.1 hypothetical protein SBP18_02270 [Rhodoferax ferrireducens]